MRNSLVVSLFVAAALLTGCSKKPSPPPPLPTRCEADLAALGVVVPGGTGASAKRIESEAGLIGGPYAQGSVGDTLLKNDKVRFVIEKPGRHIGPLPYGGTILDADLTRDAGEPGRDAFGEMGVLYSFGRTVNARAVEVIADGSAGGAAVVAVSGDDSVNDFLSVQNLLLRLLGARVGFVVDPEVPIRARVTTYYTLAPGENRLRILTAVCNDGADRILTTIGDLLDRGGTIDYFNPSGCLKGLGSSDKSTSCVIESGSWFGFQGDQVAYGIRNYQLKSLSTPEAASAILTMGGVSATLAGGENSQGLLSWVNPDAVNRPGTWVIPAGQQRQFLRDFVVARDLGAVSSTFLALDKAPRGHLLGTVVRSDGTTPAPEARVSVIAKDTRAMLTLLIADANGNLDAFLPPGSYELTSALPGHSLAGAVAVQIQAAAESTVQLKLGEVRKLTVTVKDPFGDPLPAKVVLQCAGTCPTPSTAYRKFYESEVLPSNVAAITFASAQGRVELEVAPGEYSLLVSRGPEYSVWPDTWPVSGDAVDLRLADQSRTAVLGHVIDTTGWMSADLHVHSVNSADSSVPNELRVLTFAGEGVDILSSSDHDVVTDFGPYVQALGLGQHLAAMVGAEVTPFDWGHYNTYPVKRGPTVNGGAFDWAGGEGATLRPQQMFDGVRAAFPGAVVQMNHPRGPIGTLTLLRVDTATLASHSLPADFRMEPNPLATANDTGLFGEGFDAIEVLRGVDGTTGGTLYRVFNDWMTFLSRGTVRTATATSDTHYAYTFQGGYPRTYVNVGNDSPAQFDPMQFAAKIRAHEAIGTNGPFLKVTARRLDASGQPIGTATVAVGGTISVSPSAGEKLDIEVEVQALDWMSFDSLELYSHAPGRESVNGDDNSDWPDARILQAKTLVVGSMPLEPVVINSQTFRRIHFTEHFTVSPTQDGWYVVMLRSRVASRSLFPLSFTDSLCRNDVCTAVDVYPFAFANPIFVDADGTGAYDRFPLTGTRLHPLPLPPQAPVKRLTAPDEVEKALDSLLQRSQ